MRKLSRILALLLIVLMLATMSVSCKKADDEGDEAVSITDKGESGSTSEGGENETTEGEGSTTTTTNGNKKPTGDKNNVGGAGNAKPGNSQSATEKQEAIDKAEQKGEGKGSYKEDAEGNIIETGDHKVDEEYRIEGAVTNDNGFIPDEEQGLEKSERRATEASKYNFDQNPLINRDRQQNKTWEPSFEIDDTGFVRAGTKKADLKGKTLAFFTSDNFAAWSYRNAKGETVDEWSWFKELKSELGLNIKYTVKQHMKSTTAALQAMNAGKQCDIIYSNHVVFPSSICITRSITEFVNINNLGSSPGVCKTTMDICKWGNTLRLISPIGVVDVIWYNQTLTQELGLSDPHVMWEKGVWNWTSFKDFMLSAPKTTKTGEKLIAFVQWPSNASYIWPSTNGAPRIYIKAEAEVPTLINNWDNPLCISAWEFITTVCNSVNYGSSSETSAGVQPEHMGMYEGTTLMSATMYTQVYRDTEYSKHVQINWVPYPKSTTETGTEIAQYYGFGMMLPRKTVKEDNVNIALKFMELWATRFTETVFDNPHTFEYYNFNYKQRKQYFDFVTKNVVFALAMNDFDGTTVGSDTNFFKCFKGDSAYNVKTEAAKASNLVAAYVVESMKFGQ